ncbi:hypothetical protein Tco_0296235 [Tanacetum coccineum]
MDITYAFQTLQELVQELQGIMNKLIKEQVPEQFRNQVPVYVAEGLILERLKAKEETKILIAKAILIVQQQAEDHRSNLEADVDLIFWTDFMLQMSEITNEARITRHYGKVSLTSDEAKMQNDGWCDSDIVWESRKEILVSPHPRKITPLFQSCQRDPEAPALSLINQDRLKSWKPKEEIYSNLKIVQVIKTYWELGHEHKFITEIVARRANDCIVSITEPDYKNLNKNDIEDIYLLITNGKVSEELERERVMRHSEIYKFCDATLNRVLEGLKSYNNDVKYGYVQRELTNDEVEYLKLFEEEIEVRLKYRNLKSAQSPRR